MTDARKGPKTEADFLRYLDGGSVSPRGFMEEVREMDAKWARGEYPIQRAFRRLTEDDPTVTDGPVEEDRP